MGAEFILEENTFVQETAERLGLGLLDKGMRYGRRELRGADEFDPADLDAAVAEIERATAAGEGHGLSARELVERLEMPTAVREALAARTEVSSAAPADTVGSAALKMVAHINDFPAPSVAGGNQGIAIELARGLGGAVRLSEPARSVAWSEDSVTVRTDAGAVEADRCVIAVPASVVGEIAFEPALPEPIAGALASVSYGHAAKLFVPLREPAPPSAVLSVPGRYWVWTANGASGEVQPVACCFAGSAAALDRLKRHRGPRGLGRRARRPASRPRPGHRRRLRLHLGRRPLGPGRLFGLGRGGRRGDPGRSARPAELRRRAHRRRWHGLMEGALRSGQRAAGQMLGNGPLA